MTAVGTGEPIVVTAAAAVSPFDIAVTLIPVLAAAYGVVMGGAALVTGWRLFSDRRPRRYRRGVAVPPVGTVDQGEKVP